jgi:hypothetical protein
LANTKENLPRYGFIVGVIICMAFAGSAPAQDGDQQQNTMELQKTAQNPVANMPSLPIQNNMNFNTGSNDVTQNILNVQPVIPIHLNDDWNLITRTIVPIINQPSLSPGSDSSTGIGDINPQFFFSPAKPGSLIWGAGPAFLIPSATNDVLGSDKWCAGPAAVVLKMDGPWVYGAVGSYLASTGGAGPSSVSLVTVQPLVNYNMSEGWYLTSSPIITGNLMADSAQRWTVPLGGGLGRVFHMGKMPVNMQLAAYGNAIKPDNGPDWQLRFQIQFLFPK